MSTPSVASRSNRASVSTPSVVSLSSRATLPMPSVVSVSSRAPTNNTTPFVPQLQETPLNPKALLDLPNLKKNPHLEPLQKHLAQAIEFLTKSAGDINERAFEERTKHQNKVAKLKNDDKEEPEDDKAAFETFQQNVAELTKKMDESIRQVVDDQAWLKEVPNAIDQVSNKIEEIASTSIQQRRGEEEDEDAEDPASLRPDPSENASTLLHAALTTADTQRQSLPLEERYAKDNDYKNFYTVVWQAVNQGEHAPAVPHPSVWFAEHDGQRIPRGTQRGEGAMPGSFDSAADNEMDDSGDEVQVASEQTRLTCPLTLRPFVNPVTSIKCPHSFEKDAILDMIRTSRDYLPWTPEQSAELGRLSRRPAERQRREAEMGTKAVRCPEAGCEARLSAADLQSDPALVRRVKRFQEAKRRQEEADRRAEEAEHDIDANSDDDLDDDDDDGILLSTQRRTVIPLGSSPALSAQRRRTLVKGERVSVVPQTQLSDEEMEGD